MCQSIARFSSNKSSQSTPHTTDGMVRPRTTTLSNKEGFLLPASSSYTPTQTHTTPTGTVPPRHREISSVVSQQSNCGVTSCERQLCHETGGAPCCPKKKRMCTSLTEKHESREQERTQTDVENVERKGKHMAHQVASVCSTSVLRLLGVSRSAHQELCT